MLSNSKVISSEISDPNIKFLEEKLKDIIPNYKFDRIKKSPVDNIYEIVYGGEVIYITSDAKFIFESGNLQKIIKDDDAYFRISISDQLKYKNTKDSDKDAKDLLTKMNKEVASWIDKSPAEWFWVHNRWK